MTAGSHSAASRSENHVEETLARVASERGARVVSDVRLDLGGHTQYYSHILVDNLGLLVIDVLSWPGARVKGSTGFAKWTAKGESGPRETFANPLPANERRTKLLAEVLLTCGRRLAPEYFSDLVVFSGADISDVSVREPESIRITDADELESRLKLRYDFAMNAGALEASEVDDLVSLLRTLNRVDDPIAAAQSGRGSLLREGILDLLFRRQPAQATVCDSVAGVAPSAPRLTEDTPPDADTKETHHRAAVAAVAIPLLLMGAAVWLFQYGGLSIVIDSLSGLTFMGFGQALDVKADSLR